MILQTNFDALENFEKVTLLQIKCFLISLFNNLYPPPCFATKNTKIFVHLRERNNQVNV